MKKKILSFVLTFYLITGFCQNVSINTALLLAKNHYYQYDNSESKIDYSNIFFSDEFVVKNVDDTLFYIFNIANSKGFVIISADYRSFPILGYSYNGFYSPTGQPPAFSEWMDNKKQEIICIKANDLPIDNLIANAWDNLKTINARNKETLSGPLLQTTWDQGCYYNELCPSAPTGPCAHVWAGCVATALAQIMKYWSYPNQGTGSHSYTHPVYGTLSANFGSTTYNWANMPNSINETNLDIATLLFHCGVSVNMDYSPTGSGGAYSPVPLMAYFKYTPNINYIHKSDFSNTAWEDIIKAEIDSFRPIYYCGESLSSYSSHAFVCDGYQGIYFFHFNWGWGGSYDGYFYLSSLNPANHDFTFNQDAIINIYPSSGEFAFTGDATDAECTSVILHGAVLPHGLVTTVYFEYGTTTSFGSIITATQSPVNGNSTVLVDVNLSGLLPNTTYFFRVKVDNANGTVYGRDFSFRTAGDWVEQINPMFTSLKSVNFTDDITGYSVGDSGTIFKTINGGTNWTAQTSGTTNDLNSVFFIDANIGYAVGEDGTILHTTNGGTSWWKTYGTGTNNWLHSIFFTDVNTGYAVGDSGTILKTTNGGTSWALQTIETNHSLESNYFIDANIGYAVGEDGTILHTTNGGTSWTAQAGGTNNWLHSIFFTDVNTGYAVGDSGTILKTTDAGTNWNQQISGTTNDLRSIYFTDADTGYVVGCFKTILKTIDKGINWSTELSSGSDYWLNSVYFANANVGYIVGDEFLSIEKCTGASGIVNPTVNNNFIVHNSISNPYPNPANNSTRINYKLVNGINQGVIVFYNIQGKEIKRFEIDKTRDHLLISTTNIPAGTYFYQLQSAKENSEGKKMVIIK